MSTESLQEELPFVPQAPSQAEWDAMTPAQQEATFERLPGVLPLECALAWSMMTEGDPHSAARNDCHDTLRRFYRSQGRRAYVGSDMSVYYPAERVVKPDVFVALDVEDHDRRVWMVSREKRGLDVVFEVLASGDRAKDLRRNVARYAGLGVPEYFVFDVRTRRVTGWRLPGPGARSYDPIPPTDSVLRSRVLELELFVSGPRLRFRKGSAELLSSADLLERLEDRVNDLARTVEEQTQRLEEQTQQLDAVTAREAQERTQREQLERELEALRAELARERARRGGGA